MSTRDEAWDEGTPSWVDLATTDPKAARDFYGAAFGWDFEDTGEEYGGYLIARLDGRSVVGIGGLPPEEQVPPAWTTYLATPDVDAAAAKVTGSGGTVLHGPMDVGGDGRMAVVQDPTGAVVGLWQAGTNIGAGIVNQPGTVVWNELLTRDPKAAREFYASVVGHTFTDLPGDMDYTTIDGPGPGDTVGGLGALGEDAPADQPSHWMTYFEAADTDAVVATMAAHGGTVIAPPFDSEFGRIAVVRDPQGATFSVLQAPAST